MIMPRILLAAALLLALVAGSAVAEEAGDKQKAAAGANSAAQIASGLKTLDWIIIAVYGAGTIALGVYFSRQQETTKDYFVGGGNINPFLIGISLFATLLSTISYRSMPGESLGKGPVNLLGMLALPLVYVVIAYGFIPAYMKQRVTSAYELLEARLGLSVRLLGASMFLALRLVWMTLLVYLAAQAMAVMINIDYWIVDFSDWSMQSMRFSNAKDPSELPGIFRWDGSTLLVSSISVIVLFTCVVSIIYTTLGGLRAVVVTDFMQTVLLFGGALLVIATVTWDFGGFGWVPTKWQPHWDTQPVISFDPRTRITVVGSILALFVWYVGTAAGDQTSVQRFMATRDVRAARRAFATQLIVGATIGLTLYAVGFALLGFFQQHPEAMPSDMSIDKNADDLFPRFIAYHLPIGISGLVVAALFAAGMSSIDSGVNSIAAVVSTDFLGRLGWQADTEKGAVRTAQMLALVIGVVVVLGSTFMKYIPGNITEVTGKTVNLPTVPIFCLFFFALFVPFARPSGVWAGAICGTIVASAIAFSGPLVVFLATNYDVDPDVFGVELTEKNNILVTAVTETDPETGALVLDPKTNEPVLTPRDPITFQWMGPIALIVNILVGLVVSLLVGRFRRK